MIRRMLRPAMQNCYASKFFWTAISTAFTCAFTACAVGPDYQRPNIATPAAFKEAGDWKPAAPADAADRGRWWQVFADSVLDELEAQVAVSNPTLAADEAAYRQAKALVSISRAAYFPTLGATASASRSRAGFGNNSSGAVIGKTGSDISDSFNTELEASWVPDLWGKVRRTVESSVASAQARAADLANAQLSLQSTLATDYFQLRVIDEEKRLYDATIEGYQRSYQLTQNQYAAGVASQADVITAQTQLQSTQAAAIDLGTQRAQYEHAIAVLIGKPPAEFSIAPLPFNPTLPQIPLALPADLLQRRPDIAAQERTIAAANAQIGVAIAAYYPDLTLSAAAGFASSQLAHWIEAPYRVWSLGPQLAATIFDGGARAGQVASARATYDQNVALYRQTVLVALQSVEDQLAALRVLGEEQGVQDAATRASMLAVTLTLNQYQAGTIDYSSVVAAQVTALNNQRSQLSVTGNRLIASVALIEALGGGWNAADLPPTP
jgi:NodT family efflux transporter outer membrane factor (OMF) lipoprotein